MSVNKVIYGNQTLIDISDSTVTADKLSSGITAYDKAGNKITGTNTAGNVYKGTFTISNAKTVTVTGFNFTPKYIMFAMKTLSGYTSGYTLCYDSVSNKSYRDSTGSGGGAVTFSEGSVQVTVSFNMNGTYAFVVWD